MSGAARRAAPAVAAAAVLLLGACGGDGGDGGEEENRDSQPSQEAREGGDTGGAVPGGDDLNGTWTTGTQRPFDILIFQSEAVTYTDDSGERACAGQVTDGHMELMCQNAETSSAHVTLESEELSVAWEDEGGGTDVFQRVDDAVLEQIPGLEDFPGLEDLQDLQGALEGAVEGSDG